MPIILYTKNGQQVSIEDQPLASGGEGAIHKITSSNYQGCCVKLYYLQYRTKQREQKLEYMVQNPPPNLQSNSYVICWAKELVFQNNQFVGFILPLAFQGSIQLYELCNTTIRNNLSNIWKQKYDRSNILPRLKLCVNTAIAIHNIHSLKKYVFVDMKPQNILVTDDGKVSIIDLDSVQISNGNHVLHHAQVATPEYVPFEGERLNPSQHFIPETWDRFSMAVMFYELLFGLHPFTGSNFKGQYSNITTLAECINNGLFVHGSKRHFFSIIIPLHNNFDILPPEFKDLFMRAFENGHNNPHSRPTAEEWGRTIHTLLSQTNITIKNPTQTVTVQTKTKTVTTQNTKQVSPVNTQKPKNNKNTLITVLVIIGVILAAIFMSSYSQSQQRERDWQEAESTGRYQWFIDKYPTHEYSQQAREKMQEKENNQTNEIPVDITAPKIIGKKYKVTAIGGLLLRHSASRSSEYILVIPQNTFIVASKETFGSETVENTFGYWRKVAYNGKVGYVFDGFLEEINNQGNKLSYVETNDKLKTVVQYYFNNTKNHDLACLEVVAPRMTRFYLQKNISKS